MFYESIYAVLRCVIPVVLVQQQRILCITRTVKHNYILLSSAVRIQLHVSALYVDHLQVEIQLTDQLYKMCGGVYLGIVTALGHGTPY